MIPGSEIVEEPTGSPEVIDIGNDMDSVLKAVSVEKGQIEMKNGVLHMLITINGNQESLPLSNSPVFIQNDYTKDIYAEEDNAEQPPPLRRLETGTGEVIYDSEVAKSECYWQTLWLWCACCEPIHNISTNFVKSEVCSCVGRKVNTMSMEVITDVKVEQCCCTHACNYVGWCGLCCEDVGTLVLYGKDKTHTSGEWRLERVHGVTRVHEDVTLWLQYLHKDYRLQILNRVNLTNDVKDNARGD